MISLHSDGWWFDRLTMSGLTASFNGLAISGLTASFDGLAMSGLTASFDRLRIRGWDGGVGYNPANSE